MILMIIYIYVIILCKIDDSKKEGESMDILLFFQSIRSDILTAIFTTFTICTEQVAVVLIAAIMYWCIDKKCGQRLLFAVTGSITINSGLKNFFKAPRPIGSRIT